MANDSPIPTQVEVESVEPVIWAALDMSNRVVYQHESRANVEMNAPYIKTPTRVVGLIAQDSIDSIITARVAVARQEGATATLDELCREVDLAASQAAPAKTEGWQLVPLYATPEMLKAFFAEEYTQNGYIEMLRVAPAAPSTLPEKNG